MKIPVLTYHSTNIAGNEYHNNDHIALYEDLKLIDKLNIGIISAMELVQWVKGELILSPSKSYVVLTFDDGCELDYCDWKHPSHGLQHSFYSSMKKYNGKVHATSFVIASKQARGVLVDTCTAGFEIWGDDWWQQAENSGLLCIENHSWDHLHTTLVKVKQKDNVKGDFSKVDNLVDSNAQIKDASDYINSQITNKKTSLFAYPYGHYNDYLTLDYFPKQQDEILAAFTCEAEHTTQRTNLWKIPRYVCGFDWKTSGDLQNLLNS